MKPLSPFSHKYFKQRNLVELAWSLANNYKLNWKAMPFVQKYYAFARKIFVKKNCATGHSAFLALD